ncbi:oxygenase MpaB family protein [Bradyrhizobium sp. HKCCYLS1011]|uniref:oxygenase MpaB family protein n=1 Tax=Bradyrhizobium sp. HKCCYLS1011 TaxID=3420733 RepID=UPI003EBF832F
MIVSETEFERCLDAVRAAPAASGGGTFGPDSATWQVNREAAIFLGAGRALLLQLAHPWVAAGISDQSNVFADPLGRFHRTFNIVFTMAFGTRDQAIAVAQRLYRRHAAVAGEMPETAGPFVQGSHYCANEVNALRWVHSTLVETAIMAHDLVLPPLDDAERERYWTEEKLLASLFGIPQGTLPPDWCAFQAYAAEMIESDVLTVTSAARDIAHRIFSGHTMRFAVPFWYRALTAQILPERLRLAFDLPFGAAEQRSAERAVRWLRRIYPALPDRLRTVGPYQEAQARINGEPVPPLATRLLNRAWIGQPVMTPASGRSRNPSAQN